MLMNRLILFGAICCAPIAVEASARVAVLQFGKQAVIHRTTSETAETSQQGVTSFWQAVHNKNNNKSRRQQVRTTDMTIVPDLFHSADSGIVIGLSSGSNNEIDFSQLATISQLVAEKDERVVGTMEVEEGNCEGLIKSVKDVDVETTQSLAAALPKHAERTGLSAIQVVVDNSNAKAIDEEIRVALEAVQKYAEKAGKNVVVHVIVDEPIESYRQRVLMSRRRLNQNNNVDDDVAGNNGQQQQYSGYYGYGYYNAYGEWVTPYKTMFQIQYFNVVTWTAVGLVVGLMFTIYLMMYMPLEPDTLLFGESAKLVGEE